MGFRTAGEPRGPVGSGIDCFIMQDNNVLGFSTDMNINEDYMLEGVQSLGYWGNRYFVSMGYDLNFDMNTYLLRGRDIKDSLSTPGFQSDGSNNINSAGLYTFTGLDVHSLTVLFTLMGCMYGGGSTTVAVGSLLKKATRWKGRAYLPGLQTS